MTSPVRAQPFVTPMHAAGSPTAPAATVSAWTALKDRAAATHSCGITPATIMSPTRSDPGPWTEIRPGARAHTPTSHSRRPAPVKRSALGPPGRRRADRAPPQALNQQPTVASATHTNVNPDATFAGASLHR
jgi:hypothetical protein